MATNFDDYYIEVRKMVGTNISKWSFKGVNIPSELGVIEYEVIADGYDFVTSYLNFIEARPNAEGIFLKFLHGFPDDFDCEILAHDYCLSLL